MSYSALKAADLRNFLSYDLNPESCKFIRQWLAFFVSFFHMSARSQPEKNYRVLDPIKSEYFWCLACNSPGVRNSMLLVFNFMMFLALPVFSQEGSSTIPEIVRVFFMSPRSAQVAFVQKLQPNRTKLSFESQWLLAAFEVEIGMITHEGAQVARTILLNEPSIDSGFFNPEITGSLNYKHVNTIKGESPWKSQSLGSPKNAIKIFRNLLRHPLISSDEHTLIAKIRSEWLEEIPSLSKHLSHQEILEYFKDFTADHMRPSATQIGHYRQFLEACREMLQALQVTFADNTRSLKQVERLLVPWFLVDFPYVLERSSSLTFIKYFDLVKIQMTAVHIEQLDQFLKRRNSDPDDYLMALILRMNARAGFPLNDKDIELRAIRSLYSAEARGGLLDRYFQISVPHLGSTYLAQKKYYTHIRNFLTSSVDSPQSQNAQALLAARLPKSRDITEAEWDELEWLRYERIAKNLTRAELLSELEKKILAESSSDHEERLLAARFFRAYFSREEVEKMAASLKNKYRSKILGRLQSEDHFWFSKDSKLIPVLVELSPQDSELREYLVKIYIQRSQDGRISQSDQLSYLERAQVRDLRLLEEIYRRLSVVQVGDTARLFRAFIRIFPNEGEKIINVIITHKAHAEKLIPLLRQLVEECKINYQLIDVIADARRNLQNSLIFKEKEKGNFLLEQLYIDDWLVAKVGATQKLFCSWILRGSK